MARIRKKRKMSRRRWRRWKRKNVKKKRQKNKYGEEKVGRIFEKMEVENIIWKYRRRQKVQSKLFIFTDDKYHEYGKDKYEIVKCMEV